MEDRCRNIAITGTYGSGKSSIIRTFQHEAVNEYKFVNISLSTLDNNNQDIESSIVQQLLYKTDSKQSGQYRYVKPYILETKYLCGWIIGILVFILSLCIAFEPQWLRIEGIYSLYGLLGSQWGHLINVVADTIAFGYIICFIAVLLCIAIKRFHSYSIKRLDIYNTSIEFSETASVFNKHLDEIYCFFRATKANVVVFEDLDRFENSRSLFLKLRELNDILNESEGIKGERTIKFIYAIKDDIFEGEQRTKYFDYIVSAIPVINASNSADYLINQYGKTDGREKPIYEITNQQWQELGAYIHGMRELYNIVNEFTQYKSQVGESLEDHKLFAITIYKNKYPKDYSLLHSKSGALYLSIEAKEQFLEKATKELYEKFYALKQNIDGVRKQLNGIRNDYIKELKNSYSIVGFVIKGNEHPLSDISKIDEVFRAFVENSIEQYFTEVNGKKCYHTYDLRYDTIDEGLNDGNGYKERVFNLESQIAQKTGELTECEHQIISVSNSSLSNIISSIKDGTIALDIIKKQFELYYKSEIKDKSLNTEEEEQCKMILFLLRNGYIEENYPQYISYFYPGSLTENDNKYLQSITLGLPLGAEYKLDSIEDVIERMVTEYYKSSTALNFDVVDFLSVHSKYTFIDHMLLNIQNMPKFMVEYDRKGAECNAFFEYVLANKEWFLDVAFHKDNIELQDELVVLFLKYCPLEAVAKYKKYIDRLNGLYSLISNNISLLDIDHVCRLLNKLRVKFSRIYVGETEDATKLYNYILDHSLYAINGDNVKTILAEDFNKKSLSSILLNSNSNVKEYMFKHLDVIKEFIPDTSTEEDNDVIKTFINDVRFTGDFKQRYIAKQSSVLIDLNGVNTDVLKILFVTDHIAVSWGNILDAYTHKSKQIEETLIEFIIRHYETLKEQMVRYNDDDVVSKLFDLLFGTNTLPANIYAALLPLFSFEFAKDEDLSELASERMSIVISHNKIEYGDDSFALIQEHFSEELLAQFLITNFDEFIEDNNGANNEVYWRILDSAKLDIKQKVRLLKRITEIDNDSYAHQFADGVCQCYLAANFTAEDNIELILNALTYCTSWDLKIRTINRVNQILSYDRSREIQMMEALGNEYLKLNTTYGSASFDINDHNRELLEYLKLHRHFVSDYKEKDNQFKVSFLHSC